VGAWILNRDVRPWFERCDRVDTAAIMGESPVEPRSRQRVPAPKAVRLGAWGALIVLGLIALTFVVGGVVAGITGVDTETDSTLAAAITLVFLPLALALMACAWTVLAGLVVWAIRATRASYADTPTRNR
jgi:hypothetical protein